MTKVKTMMLVSGFTEDLSKVINRCPATIFATSRTDNLTGRITDLSSSIITIKGIRPAGEPVGTRCASIKVGCMVQL